MDKEKNYKTDGLNNFWPPKLQFYVGTDRLTDRCIFFPLACVCLCRIDSLLTVILCTENGLSGIVAEHCKITGDSSQLDL